MKTTAGVALLALALLGCESGTDRVALVEMDDALVRRFSEAAPAALVSDMGGGASVYAVLCGRALEQPLRLLQANLYSCLDDKKGTSETVGVWLQPLDALPAGLACSTQQSPYTPLALAADAGADAGADAVPAAQPRPKWAQSTASGTWERDFSPCGGTLEVTLRLTAP